MRWANGWRIAATASLLTAFPAMGHLPIFSDGTADGPESAIQIDDVTVSRVVYHEVTDGSKQLWVQFQGSADQTVSFRLGVPRVERLANFRPALAVIGPGLAEADLPFDVPDGLGATILQADPGEALQEFDEEFTGTQSWIVGDLDVTFPQDGTYYAAAYVPSGDTGKLWLAFGDREVFGLEQIATFGEVVNRVRAFHEAPPALIPCLVPILGAVGLAATAVWFHGRRGSRARHGDIR